MEVRGKGISKKNYKCGRVKERRESIREESS
jgi:hypothetical protein